MDKIVLKHFNRVNDSFLDFRFKISDPKYFWNSCNDAAFLFRIVSRVCVTDSTLHRKIVKAACKCCRLAFKRIPEAEKLILNEISLIEGWTDGENLSIEEVSEACSNCWVSYRKSSDCQQRAIASVAYLCDSVVTADYVVDSVKRAINSLNVISNLLTSPAVSKKFTKILKSLISYKEVVKACHIAHNENIIRNIIE